MGGIDKIFAPLLDLPLIAHTLDAFESFDGIDDIVLVLDPASRDKGQELSCQRGYRKVLAVCEGGSRRQDSVKERTGTPERLLLGNRPRRSPALPGP